MLLFFQVGDGTTSVIVLAGEILAAAEQFLEKNFHPTVIIREYKNTLEAIVTLLEGPLSVPIDTNNISALTNVVSFTSLRPGLYSVYSQSKI